MKYLSILGLVALCFTAGWAGGRYGSLECDTLQVNKSITVGNDNNKIYMSTHKEWTGIEITQNDKHIYIYNNPREGSVLGFDNDYNKFDGWDCALYLDQCNEGGLQLIKNKNITHVNLNKTFK